MIFKELPDGWIIKKMPDVAKWSSGGTPKASVLEYYDGGTIPWLIIGDLNDGIVTTSQRKITELGLKNSSAKVIPANTLLVAMYGSIGKLGITGMECCTNQAIAFAKELYGVSTKYLYYYLMLLKPELISKGKGGAQKNISLTVLNSFSVIVPPPIEQERIVYHIEESLSQLDSAVATLRKTKQQLEIYRQAVLKEAFEGKLSINHSVNIDLPFLPKDETNVLPTIPKQWRYIKLSFLGELARGKSKHRPRNDKILFENGKYPFIQTGDVKNADNYITSYTSMYGEYGLQQSKLWKKGTLCITIAANIAETAFLGIDACFPDSVVGFIPSKYVKSEYVRYFIDSQKKRLWAFAPATAQKNINLKTLENLIVPYCSLEEQQNIVAIIDEKLSSCNYICQTIENSLQQAEALWQSILKQAFEGNG